MLQRQFLKASQFLSNSNNIRATLILGTLLLAALASSAPSDFGP